MCNLFHKRKNGMYRFALGKTGRTADRRQVTKNHGFGGENEERG
jgi:hypothetical protein